MSNLLLQSYWDSIAEFGPLLKGFFINEILISGSDSCTGDSGGPLIYREYANRPWYQVGIVSFGYGDQCGSKYPGIYTKVGGYLDWIEKHLED